MPSLPLDLCNKGRWRIYFLLSCGVPNVFPSINNCSGSWSPIHHLFILLMFIIRQQRLTESMWGIQLQRHGEEEWKGTQCQDEDEAFRKHQLTAGKAAMMLRIFLPVLLSSVFLFQAQIRVAETGLTSRKIIRNQICAQIIQGKGNRAPRGLESWDFQQVSLLVWPAANRVLANKSISSATLGFAEASGLRIQSFLWL